MIIQFFSNNHNIFAQINEKNQAISKKWTKKKDL
jgi:hypothetical protein